jgi:hypothetical protein
MPDLIPVEHDPFTDAPSDLLPVAHDPFSTGLDMPALMGEKSPLQGGVAMRSPDIGPAPDVIPGALNMQDYRAMLLPQVQGLGNVGTPMDWAIAMAGGPKLGPKGITAYHGSPYDFEKFDLSKIGTGEGAQAYGHGLYFAENPAVAAAYKQSLAGGPRYTLNGKEAPEELQSALWAVDRATPGGVGKTPRKITYDVLDDAKRLHLQKLGVPANAKEYLAPFETTNLEGQTLGLSKPTGHGYEVSIAADPAHFLDWDKPVKEQHPKVQEAVKNAYEQLAPFHQGLRMPLEYAPEKPGSQIASELSAGSREGYTQYDHAQASESLRSAGIPGIKYLDQESRGTPFSVSTEFRPEGDQYLVQGPGNIEHGRFDTREAARAFADKKNAEGQTSNYVVFDDNLINIIRKYGMAPLIAGGVAHYATTPVDHDPFAEEKP